jgi:hypothetical protein
MTREGEGGMIEESAAKKRAVRKSKPFKPIPENAFENQQLSLFQDFLANTDNERAALSNAVDLWDSIPRYALSRKNQDEMRLPGGYLPIRKVAFHYRGIPLIAVVRPARIEVRDEAGKPTGETIEYYPSAREELIEHALRRLAAAPPAGFYDQPEQRSGLVFTLHRLRQELASQGHAMTYKDLAEGLDVLSLGAIDLETSDPSDPLGVRHFARSTYFPKLIGVTRDDLEKNPEAKWYVEFHPFVTESIDKVAYRQFNYRRLMKCRTQLARWLISQLVLKYTAAAVTNSFEMRFSTIKRDSGLLEGYRLQRQAVAALDNAWEEVKDLGALYVYKKVEHRGSRGKLEDAAYTLFPSREFAAEQKAANRRQNDAKSIASTFARQTTPQLLEQAKDPPPIGGPVNKAMRTR